MNDYIICQECGEHVSPASNYGPHISAHRRTENAKYKYLNGDTKHPYEYKACLNCKEELWIQKRRDFCSRRCSKLGEFNPLWKGDAATPKTARIRAHNRFEIGGQCNRCENPVEHRHHIDGNTYNNEPDNIELICAVCHGREHMLGNTLSVGEKHPKAKLTESDVLEIRKRCEQGEGPQAIAEDYPVTPSVVSNIKAKRIWKHV